MQRRRFLRDAGLAIAAPALWPAVPAFSRSTEPFRVAAILTECTYRSHAHVILENFLQPYLFNGQRTESGMQIAGIYLDQTPDRDMGREVAKQFNIPIYPTIAETLMLGGPKLAVDAVLSIGEHGNYPTNAKGQREYPRKRFFDEIVAVFDRSDRVVPVFNDKHLSFRWDWAKAMVDEAQRRKIPLMAGSSVPLAERRPPLDIPLNSRFRSAVSIHAGPVESYDFHGLEVLQSQVEAREGGETGVKSVEFVPPDRFQDAVEQGGWIRPLAEAALRAELGPDTPPLAELLKKPEYREAHAILLEYRDGLRAAVLRLGGRGIRWDFAATIDGRPEPAATSYYVGPWDNRNLFKALSHAIQHFFRTGVAPYPVERTLLVSGVLDAAMDSRIAGGKVVETPHLAIDYRPKDFRDFRESGATWKIVTPETPEPKGLDSADNYRPR